MKAIVSRTKGGPELLEYTDVADPLPGPGQVLIRVNACGLNYPDTLVIDDRYQVKPVRPFSPGFEVSGIVAALGDGVTSFIPGDRVMATTPFGGMAEKAVAEAAACFHIPPGLTDEEAAAFLLTYGTSYFALHVRGHIRAGETLLVLGAAGGAGISAVQLGKAAGARVIAAVSSDDKARFARLHGADETLVYPRGPLQPEAMRALGGQIKALCGAAGADVVYDAVGGDYAEPALRATGWFGRYLVIGFPAGIPKIPLNLPLLKNCDIVGIYWGAWVEREPMAYRDSIAALVRLAADGSVRPVVSERFDLAEGAKGLDWLMARKAMGKVVVTMPGVRGK